MADISWCIKHIQSLQFIEIMFKNSISIARKTVAVRNSNWLMLFREVNAVCYENHTECINALCVQNAEFLSVRQRYKYVEIKCQLDAERFLLQILLLAQHVSGITMPIIRSSRVLYSGCCLWYFVL